MSRGELEAELIKRLQEVETRLAGVPELQLERRRLLGELCNGGPARIHGGRAHAAVRPSRSHGCARTGVPGGGTSQR